ncbi:coiled-coil domain-containing protein [Sesbania bispinosa]|nr:coiled-coil domain-containing protein [Sesbania bispinosa]
MEESSPINAEIEATHQPNNEEPTIDEGINAQDYVHNSGTNLYGPWMIVKRQNRKRINPKAEVNATNQSEATIKQRGKNVVPKEPLGTGSKFEVLNGDYYEGNGHSQRSETLPASLQNKVGSTFNKPIVFTAKLENSTSAIKETKTDIDQKWIFQQMKIFEKAQRDKIMLDRQMDNILEDNVMTIDDDTLAFVRSKQKVREELERANKPPDDTNIPKGNAFQDIECMVNVSTQDSDNHVNNMDEEQPSKPEIASEGTSH